MIYLTGEVQDCASAINDLLLEMGCVPAIVAAQQARHADMTLHDVLQSVRQAHAAYYQLHQPLATLPQPLPPTAARVPLNLVLDRGEVPTSTGGLREDESHLVVLDGMCTEDERRQLLTWLTAEDHDHSGPPPGDKWEQSCVDRTGDRPTWGLKREMLEALQTRPPPALVSIQSRLACLYPEHDICYMPATAFLEDMAADDEEPLSAFVGNAVMPGDPCAWHADMNPTELPGSCSWVQHYGYYVNREPGKPLFVSALMYLNDEWPEDMHAETLFLDPETQAGIFVRPSPGRLVLMDQDMPHRISQPSQHASGPRYSLVWKLVLIPKQDTSSRVSAGAVPPCTISRPEWGHPMRFGSANPAFAMPAWRSQHD